MALELLAPARDADQGILALRCGADAVYMGGPRFGARQAVGQPLQAFERLCSEARLWNAKVYATLNTILFDHELEAARTLAWNLFELGVDAFIVQDMAFLELDLPPLPLHASTQAACDSPEKVAFLERIGFQRAILARESSLSDIRAIRAATSLELEAFVFGALCVGESGRCYLSGSICGRSGNRGECAQPCRSPWNMVDAQGRVLIREQHLLSLRDLDLSDHLEALAEAGIVSFKIEGRLKDADYVKNVVSYLRRKLDALLERRPDWERASLGRVRHGFEPDPHKTFNRGFSTYRIEDRRQPMGTPEAAHHLGEPIGRVRSVQGNCVILDRTTPLGPGDGIAFLGPQGPSGTVVNAVEGAQVFVQNPKGLKPGSRIHRNLDHRWLKQLRTAKVERRIPVTATLTFTPGEAVLSLQDPTGLTAEARISGTFESPHDPEATDQAIQQALSRFGNTPFERIALNVPDLRFVPLNALNTLRREAAEALEALRRAPRERPSRPTSRSSPQTLPTCDLDYTWNVANRAARAFYERLGARVLEPAAECQASLLDRVVMTTRHCLAFELGWCGRHPNPRPWRSLPRPDGPLFLENGATRLECTFDCAQCRMRLVLRKAPR